MWCSVQLGGGVCVVRGCTVWCGDVLCNVLWCVVVLTRGVCGVL